MPRRGCGIAWPGCRRRAPGRERRTVFPCACVRRTWAAGLWACCARAGPLRGRRAASGVGCALLHSVTPDPARSRAASRALPGRRCPAASLRGAWAPGVVSGARLLGARARGVRVRGDSRFSWACASWGLGLSWSRLKLVRTSSDGWNTSWNAFPRELEHLGASTCSKLQQPRGLNSTWKSTWRGVELGAKVKRREASAAIVAKTPAVLGNIFTIIPARYSQLSRLTHAARIRRRAGLCFPVLPLLASLLPSKRPKYLQQVLGPFRL